MKIGELRSLISEIKFHLYIQGKPIAYVSGKVTGLPEAEVSAKFQLKQDELEAGGYAVFNPAEWIPIKCDWKTAMRVCVAILPVCESIWMLKDWMESKGACEERRIAEKLGLTIFHPDDKPIPKRCKHQNISKSTLGWEYCKDCGETV